MAQTQDALKTVLVKRLLRDYYNECVYVIEMLDAEDIDVDEAEGLLIDIDEKYAVLVVDEFIDKI